MEIVGRLYREQKADGVVAEPSKPEVAKPSGVDDLVKGLEIIDLCD